MSENEDADGLLPRQWRTRVRSDVEGGFTYRDCTPEECARLERIDHGIAQFVIAAAGGGMLMLLAWVAWVASKLWRLVGA